MMKRLTIILFVFSSLACNDIGSVFKQDDNKAVTYSYSCLDSTLSGKPLSRSLDKAGDLIRDLAVSEKSITDNKQTEYGKLFHDQMIQEGVFKLISNEALQQKLNTVLQKLLSQRENPSGISYSIYALKDTAINAFTFGGRIYVTQGMLDKCMNRDALLYAIVGHEIGHSELGHIKNVIQEMELSNKIFGEEAGATFFRLKQMLAASFNQKNELEADYYGINLTHALNQDVCSAVNFWMEMASEENSYNEVEDFFRTHPFSNLRAQCLVDHIQNNFDKTCKGWNKSNVKEEVLE